MSRPEEYTIEKTVWRPVKNHGDELVVAEGTVNTERAFIMAWEVKADRPETVSWNGKVSYFPRMHWLDQIPADHIKIYNYQENKEYHVKNDKHYKIIDGDVYVKFIKMRTITCTPSFTNVIISAKFKKINYVLCLMKTQNN